MENDNTPKSSKKFAVGALIACVAGYLAGILTAPKSGKETRGDIQRAASKTKTDAERNLKNLYSELHELTEQGSKKVKQLRTRGKTELKAAVDKGTEAKGKARELLTALHDGDADDKDLHRAITEVKKAIKHLKTFALKDAGQKKKR